MEQWNEKDIERGMSFIMNELIGLDVRLTETETGNNRKEQKGISEEIEELENELLDKNLPQEEVKRIKEEIEKKREEIEELEELAEVLSFKNLSQEEVKKRKEEIENEIENEIEKKSKEIEELKNELFDKNLPQKEVKRIKEEIEKRKEKIKNLDKIPLSKVKKEVENIVNEKMSYLCFDIQNDDEYCSLEYYLAEHCLKEMFKESSILESELLGQIELSPQKRLEKAIEISGEKRNGEELIKKEKRRFFKIIDSILGNKGHNRLTNSGGYYSLNLKNCKFFDYLFSIFEEKDSKKLRKDKLEEIDDKYLDELYKGMIELAENPEMLITKEEIYSIWNKKFCMPYRKMVDEFENLQATIRYYSSYPSKIDKNIQFFNVVREKIKMLNESILQMGKEMTEL